MAILVGLVGIQFIPTSRNQSEGISPTDFMIVESMPLSVGQILKASCYDCHSAHTQYPWYNRIQPLGWYLENHIKEGRAELDFSEWDNYSDRRKRSKLKSIISQVAQDEMPLTSYTLMHPEARMTEAEKKVLLSYMENLLEVLEK